MAPPSVSRLRRILRTARQAAAEVGALVAARYRPEGIPARRKGPGDFVTAVDLQAERELQERLRREHPEIAFLGEEGEPKDLQADWVWVVDPIDGTSNFSRGLAPYAVSVACLHLGQPVVAAMLCQPEGALYSAAAGLGAFLGRRRLRIPQPPPRDDALVIGCQWHRDSKRLAFLGRLQRTGARIRNYGCTVAQLCDLVRGRLDANVQQQGRIWDIAAAGLLVGEGGGRFTDWHGRPVFPWPRLPGGHAATLAASPSLHRRLMAVLDA